MIMDLLEAVFTIWHMGKDPCENINTDIIFFTHRRYFEEGELREGYENAKLVIEINYN